MDYITIDVERLGDGALVEIDGKEYIDLEKCNIAKIGFRETWQLTFATRVKKEKTKTGKSRVAVYIPNEDRDDKTPVHYIGNGVQLFKDKDSDWKKDYKKPYDSALL